MYQVKIMNERIRLEDSTIGNGEEEIKEVFLFDEHNNKVAFTPKIVLPDLCNNIHLEGNYNMGGILLYEDRVELYDTRNSTHWVSINIDPKMYFLELRYYDATNSIVVSIRKLGE